MEEWKVKDTTLPDDALILKRWRAGDIDQSASRQASNYLQCPAASVATCTQARHPTRMYTLILYFKQKLFSVVTYQYSFIKILNPYHICHKQHVKP